MPAKTLAGLWLAILAPASAAERPWLEVKSPNFIVLSNASEKQARRIAWQLEQVRATFQQLWPWAKPRSGKPFLTFAARDETTLKSLDPASWERKGFRPGALWIMGADKDYVALNLDVAPPDRPDLNPYMTLHKAYVFVILRASLGNALPMWLSQGLEEVFGNTVVRDKDVLIGTPIPWHFRTLADGGRLSLATLMEVTRASPYYTQELERRRFDANCWAVTHYMIFGEKGQNAPKMNRLIALLERRKPLAAALQETYGGAAALEQGYHAHIQQPILVYQKLNVDIQVKGEGFMARPLSASEAKAARGAFHAAMRRPAEARALAAEIRKANPRDPLAYEIEGLLLDGEGKSDLARAAYGSALEQGSQSSYAHYRYASLSWRGRLDKEPLLQVRDALKRSVELNPDYSWAQGLLAEAHAELGEVEPALAGARQAVALAPAEAYHRLSLARVLWKAAQAEEALREAGIGFTLADSEEQREAAQRLLDFLKRQP